MLGRQDKRQGLKDLLVLGIGRGARHMAILPGAELIHHEEHAIIAPNLSNLLVYKGKPFLEFAMQTTLRQFGAHQFLTELPQTRLRPVFLRGTRVFPAEEIGHTSLFVVARLFRIPVGRQLWRGDFHLLIKLGSKRPDTFPDLLLENTHEAVTVTRFTHAAQREGHREYLYFGECRSIVTLNLGIAHGVPHGCVIPDEEVDKRAQKVRLASTVFCLHPKALPLAVHDALEDPLEVRPQRQGKMVVTHRLARFGTGDRLRQARCGLWLRLNGDDPVEWTNVHGLSFLPKDLLDDSWRIKIFEQAVCVACHLLGPWTLFEEAIKKQYDHSEIIAEPFVKLSHASVVPGEEADRLHNEHRPSLCANLQ